jgi:RimJ/RimL family protein N-acetyltransferase
MIEIETERLTLKKLGISDKDRLIYLIGDSRVSETLSNVPYPYTDEDAEYWLNSVNTSEFKLSIFRNSVLIGGIGLTPEDDGYWEFGYWLGFEYWGKGYATEACNGLLNYAKTNTSYKNFKANVYKGNTASSKVLEKVGFRQTGEGKVFSLSKQENIPCLNYEYCL